MIEGFASGAVAGLGIAIPVGAVGALILLAAATSGWRIGAAAGMGAATADGVYAAIAVVAGAAIAPFLASVSTPLRWASAVVLVVLGSLMIRSALQASGDRDVSANGRVLQTPVRSFAAVFAITIVNPLTVIYFAALVIGSSTSRGTDVASGLPFIAGAFLASAAWQLLLATAGSVLGRVMSGHRARMWTTILGGAIVIALAARTIVDG